MGIKKFKMLQRHKVTKELNCNKSLCLCVFVAINFFPMRRLTTIFILLMMIAVSCKTPQPVTTSNPVKTKTDTVKQTAVVKDSVITPKQKIFHISLFRKLV